METDTNSDAECCEKYKDYAAAVSMQLARKLPRSIMADEIVGYGMEGLLEACRKYDENDKSGATFKTFARYRIRGAVIDNVRRMTRCSRREKAGVLNEEPIDNIVNSPEFTSNSAGGGIQDAAFRLSRAVRNIAMSYVISEYGVEPVDNQSAAESAEIRELIERLKEAIKKLSAKEQKIVELMYFKGLSVTETAEVFGIHKANISKPHKEILEKLAAALKLGDN
ncbi:MAG: sigma-70 family RNA polymerase sigma factor [Planctomycetes bacterium]|nr:sigma-70 family RNA polymerase sigma factor [Planctomycetota bacterium]